MANLILVVMMLFATYNHWMVGDKFERLAPSLVCMAEALCSVHWYLILFSPSYSYSPFSPFLSFSHSPCSSLAFSVFFFSSTYLLPFLPLCFSTSYLSFRSTFLLLLSFLRWHQTNASIPTPESRFLCLV